MTQPLVRRLEVHRPGWGTVIGLTTAALGMLTGAAAVHWGLWAVALPADMLLGTSYGLILASSLIGVHEVTAPNQAASAVAVFYALTYIGFTAPLIVTGLTHLIDGSDVLVAAAIAAAITLVLVHRGRRHCAQGPDGDLACTA